MVRELTRRVARSMTQAALRRDVTAVTADVLAMTLALMLSGCTAPQERAAQAQADVERMMATYGPACFRLGYAAQSDAWRSCVIGLSTKYDLQHSAPPPGC